MNPDSPNVTLHELQLVRSDVAATPSPSAEPAAAVDRDVAADDPKNDFAHLTPDALIADALACYRAEMKPVIAFAGKIGRVDFLETMMGYDLTPGHMLWLLKELEAGTPRRRVPTLAAQMAKENIIQVSADWGPSGSVAHRALALAANAKRDPAPAFRPTPIREAAAPVPRPAAPAPAAAPKVADPADKPAERGLRGFARLFSGRQ